MIETIGIIGCGKMGTDIFHFLSSFSYRIILVCKSQEKIDSIEKSWLRKLKRSLTEGFISEKEFNLRKERIRLTTDLRILSDADLVIESISENQPMKQELMHDLDGILKPGAIMASNTSSIPIARLVPSERRRNAFTGLHFFYPVALKNIIEINKPGNLKSDVLNRITEFLSSIGKSFIILAPGNHFLINRLFLKFQAGAFHICLERKIPYEYLDQMIRNKFFPSGVFRFFDHVGIDIMYNSVKNYTEFDPDSAFYEPMLSDFEGKIKHNLLGIKTGRGFYDYREPVREGVGLRLPEETENEIYMQLAQFLLEPMRLAIVQKCITREELVRIVNEYIGSDLNPLDLAKETGFSGF